MPLSAIVAATSSGVIGRDGDMPWHLRSDLKRFKSITMGHTLVMGRKTYDSIGRPLPGRQTVVLTRNATWQAEGVQVFHQVDAVLDWVGGSNAFVVGGAQIYSLLMSHCDRLYLTRVLANIDGDTLIALDLDNWSIESATYLPKGEHDSEETEFTIWTRNA